MNGSDRLEEYLLLLLSDSNLPTGGFVASSGLESFIQHGYLSSGTTGGGGGGIETAENGLVEFVKMSLHNYSRLNSQFVKQSFTSIERFLTRGKGKGKGKQQTAGDTFEELSRVDRLCEEMILNRISHRASIAQGNALLSLYSRALAPTGKCDSGIVELIDKVRSEIRNGETGRGWKGHQSTSFGIVMAAVGLSLNRALHLFLFLHARSILSSAVRLNLVGPYSAHRLLLWDVRQLVDKEVEELTRNDSVGTGTGDVKMEEEEDQEARRGDWWDNDQEWKFLNEDGQEGEPVTTWPLGEIVASRHDQLFTKVFNS